MHSTPPPTRRTALARHRTLRAAADYSTFSAEELIRESAQLHATLVESDQFSRAAALGLRHVVLERLLMIDAEHSRRNPGTWPAAA